MTFQHTISDILKASERDSLSEFNLDQLALAADDLAELARTVKLAQDRVNAMAIDKLIAERETYALTVNWRRVKAGRRTPEFRTPVTDWIDSLD